MRPANRLAQSRPLLIGAKAFGHGHSICGRCTRSVRGSPAFPSTAPPRDRTRPLGSNAASRSWRPQRSTRRRCSPHSPCSAGSSVNRLCSRANSRQAGTGRPRPRANATTVHRRAVVCSSALPWIPRVPISRSPSGPNQTAWLERGLSQLASTALNAKEMLSALTLLSGFVRQSALLQSELEEGRDGQAKAESERDYGAALYQVISAKRFPHLSQVLAS